MDAVLNNNDLLLLHILSHVNDMRTLCHLSEVNHRWRDLTRMDFLWQPLTVQRWPDRFPPVDPKKDRSHWTSSRFLHTTGNSMGRLKKLSNPSTHFRNTSHAWILTYMLSLKVDRDTAKILEKQKRLQCDGDPYAMTKQKRKVCAKCCRPEVTCICDAILAQPIDNSAIPIVILLHPKCPLATGTIRILRASFTHCKIFTSNLFSAGLFPELDALLENPSALLYPTKNAVDLTRAVEEEDSQESMEIRKLLQTTSDGTPGKLPVTLVVVDGTWSQARSVFRWNPRLQGMKQVKLSPKQVSIYRKLKHADSDQFLCTVEAATYALLHLRKFTQRLSLTRGDGGEPTDEQVTEDLFRPLHRLIDIQMECRSRDDSWHNGGKR